MAAITSSLPQPRPSSRPCSCSALHTLRSHSAPRASENLSHSWNQGWEFPPHVQGPPNRLTSSSLQEGRTPACWFWGGGGGSTVGQPCLSVPQPTLGTMVREEVPHLGFPGAWRGRPRECERGGMCVAQHSPTPPPVPTLNPLMKSSWPHSQRGGREGGGGRRAGRPAQSSPGTGTDSLSLHLAGDQACVRRDW